MNRENDDRPEDIEEIREDDELIEKINAGLTPTQDELIRMLAAWRDEVTQPPLPPVSIERVDEPWHHRALRWYRRELREIGLALRRVWPW